MGTLSLPWLGLAAWVRESSLAAKGTLVESAKDSVFPPLGWVCLKGKMLQQ